MMMEAIRSYETSVRVKDTRVTFQKKALSIVTAVITTTLTNNKCFTSEGNRNRALQSRIFSLYRLLNSDCYVLIVVATEITTYRLRFQ
jgi:hypothetical protein